jgi:hypothetical protein
MQYTNDIIQEAVEKGHEFIILEPQEVFESSIKEFHDEEGRIVYEVNDLLECLTEAYDWDAVMALEWFDYNVFDLTFMDKGPIFYDKYEQKYLTIDK